MPIDPKNLCSDMTKEFQRVAITIADSPEARKRVSDRAGVTVSTKVGSFDRPKGGAGARANLGLGTCAGHGVAATLPHGPVM